MRSCACDTASRLCVRTVLCSSAFLLVPSSPSTDSAADCSALFSAVTRHLDDCDLLPPCIIGYGPPAFPTRPWARLPRAGRRSPGSRTEDVRTCWGSNDDAGWLGSLRLRTSPCCLLHATTASAPRTTSLTPLDTPPIRPPVNASPAPPRLPAHDSGSVWIASPSP